MLEPFKVSFFFPLSFHVLIFDWVCSLNKYFPNIFQLSKKSIYIKGTKHLRCSQHLWLKLVLQVQPSVLPILAQPYSCKMRPVVLLGNSQRPWHHIWFLDISPGWLLGNRKMLGRCGSKCLQLQDGNRHWNADNNLSRDPLEGGTYPKWGIMIMSREKRWWNTCFWLH